MAKIILDNLVNNLQARFTAKQDRVAVSGNLAEMRKPTAVLSHPWRLMSPGSHPARERVSGRGYRVSEVSSSTQCLTRGTRRLSQSGK